MNHAYLYDHVRTPRGKGRPDGALHEVPAVRLATTVLEALRDRNQLDTARVDDVIFGIVSPVAEQGQVLPRIAAIAAGYAVVAGGVEAMSRVPIFSDGGAWTADPQVAHAAHFIPQGISADLIATRWGYSREMLDDFAARSHQRAGMAWREARFARSVVPVRNLLGEVLLDRDEAVRPDCQPADLAKLKPSFANMGAQGGFDAIARSRYPDVPEVEHRHHAGNSSGIVDGACGVLLGSRAAGEAAGLTPRGRIVSWAEIGSEPTIMLTAPSFAAERALKRAGMSAQDIDLYEINEAFAAVALRFVEAMDIDMARVNVNGGSIAMGHPLGATGAIILGTALDELERTGRHIALVTLCVGAGMGVATIIERV
jgi:acetyl-CoA C-acetyltransferase